MATSAAEYSALDAKEDTLSFTASRAIVSGSGGGLRALSVTSTEVGYLDGVTSDIQPQLDAKQTALTKTDLGTITWSAGQQSHSITTTARRGYFALLCTFDQTAVAANLRTIEVTLNISSLAESDMVIVPRYPTSNHNGGAISVGFSRPNSDLGTIRISLRSNAAVDYQNNTTDKFFVSYMIL